jgi:hypothetical protein
MLNNCEIKEFLRSCQHLPVHFSTVMGRDDLLFPNDILTAMKLAEKPLSFNTITVGDTGPFGGPGGAEGSIGMLVDIGPKTLVESVAPYDSGSSEIGSLGLPPTQQNCDDSIDKRNPSDEWRIQDYIPVGIYILPPYMVRKETNLGIGEVEITLAEAIAPFENERVFSTGENSFLELDRITSRWREVSYDQIIAPCTKFAATS